jgi:hypothetical protein
MLPSSTLDSDGEAKSSEEADPGDRTSAASPVAKQTPRVFFIAVSS